MDAMELAIADHDAIKILWNVILEFARERRTQFHPESEERQAVRQPYYYRYACNVVQDAMSYLKGGTCGGLHTQYFFDDRLMNPTEEDWKEMWDRYRFN